MNIYKRRDTLTNLIVKIYGVTTVNFDPKSYERGQYGEVIINKNGLFDKNSYTLKKRNNFDILFDITFNTAKYYFSGTNIDEHTEFNREAAIQNAVTYFREFGINIQYFFENKKEILLFSKLIYKLISTELLPAIFNTDDNRQKQTVAALDSEDITPDFSIAIKNVKNVLESKNIIANIYKNAKMSDIEIIYSSTEKVPRKECSLVTCIRTNDIANIVFEQWYFDPNIELFIEPKSRNINNINDKYFYCPIEYLKKDSFLLTYDDKASFNLPYDVKEQIDAECITINFLKNTATSYFLPRYFYYVPNLAKNSSDLCRDNSTSILPIGAACINIRRNAALALREKYKTNFKKYYENVLDSIIINTNILSSVDYNYLLNSNNCEKQDLAKALGSMSIDIDKLYDILSDLCYEAPDIKSLIILLIEYSVYMLNIAIEGIISIPNMHGPSNTSCTTASEFINQIRDYISKYEINNFTLTIESYLDKLQKIENLFSTDYSNVHSMTKEISAYISIGIKNKFFKSIKTFSEIDLDKEVFKSFRQNLITFITILKDNNIALA